MDTIKDEVSSMKNKKNYNVSKAFQKIKKTMARLDQEQVSRPIQKPGFYF